MSLRIYSFTEAGASVFNQINVAYLQGVNEPAAFVRVVFRDNGLRRLILIKIKDINKKTVLILRDSIRTRSDVTHPAT